MTDSLPKNQNQIELPEMTNTEIKILNWMDSLECRLDLELLLMNKVWKRKKTALEWRNLVDPFTKGSRLTSPIIRNTDYYVLLDVMLWDGHITSEVFFPQICNFNLQGKNIRQPQVEEYAANCLTNTLQKASRRDRGGVRLVETWGLNATWKDISGKTGEVRIKSFS